MHSKKGAANILGLTLSEVIGIVLVTFLILFLFFQFLFPSLMNLFGKAEEAGVRASFETLSIRINQLINDEEQDSFIMPYNIAKVKKKLLLDWLAPDPFFALFYFNEGKNYQVPGGKIIINPEEDCHNSPCLCICPTNEGDSKKIKKEVCLKNEKTRQCNKFSSEYKITISKGLLGPETLKCEETIGLHVLKYEKDIYIYPGIPFEDAKEKNIICSISYQIVLDAIESYKNGEYNKSIYLLKYVLEKFSKDFESPIFAVAKYYLALNYRETEQFIKALEMFEAWYLDPIADYSWIEAKAWIEAKVSNKEYKEFSKTEREKKKYEYITNYNQINYQRYNMCYLLLLQGYFLNQNQDYESAINLHLTLLDKCDDVEDYRKVRCYAYDILADSYQNTDNDVEYGKYKKAKEDKCYNVGKIVVLV